MGEVQGSPVGPAGESAVPENRRGITAIVDAVLYLGILGFSAIALIALALAAPLAIVATALAGALSAMSARGAKRGGWRVAGA